MNLLKRLMVMPVLMSGLVSVFAQVPRPMPPRLVVTREGKEEALRVSRVAVDARIHAGLAETRVTLTFANPYSRALAGDLMFPLPEGATISGYALDIQGRMVDGVIIDKDRGRQIFEKEVRRRVDPGLVEHVAGNVFRTRVYPVPANGSRTVMVRYVAELDMDANGATYRLPLAFPAKVGRFKARIEVVTDVDKPVVLAGNNPGLEFREWRRSYLAECESEDVVLDQPLAIRIPAPAETVVAVERHGDKHFFAIRTVPEIPEREFPAFAPRSIVIFWDASGSRDAADVDQECRFLSALLIRADDQEFTASVVVIRNDVEVLKPMTIRGRDGAELIKRLRALPRDGGTVLGRVTPDLARGHDLCLVFSDGLSTFGPSFPGTMPLPCYVVSSSQLADHNVLRGLAARTGGVYFNLARMQPAAAAARVGKTPYQFLYAKVNGKRSHVCVPSIPRTLTGPLTVVGELVYDDAEITLHFGWAGVPVRQLAVSVAQQNAREGTLLRTVFGQMQVAEGLQTGVEDEHLATLGKRYGLVTPRTSLLVLETLDQYVEHRVKPPVSLPAMRERFLQRMAREARAKGDHSKEHLEGVVRKWQELCMWYDREFVWHRRAAKVDKKGRPVARPRRGIFGFAFGSGRSAGAEPGDAMEVETLDPFAEESTPAGDMGSVFGGAAPAPAGAEAPAVASPVPAKVAPPPQAPVVTVKPWDPDTPYLAKLKNARDPYARYIGQRADYTSSPSFYLDCAGFFFEKGMVDLGVRVLSNLAEMDLDNPALLRVLAHRLAQAARLPAAERVFRKVLDLRPEEPQSYRDLALVIGRQGRYADAAALLYEVITRKWDRFEEIELIALVELNNLIGKAKRVGQRIPEAVDGRLVRNLELDIRVAMTWDADLTDIDLWVLEPSGEKCFYSHNRTVIGGHLSKDFTQGYGPEEYMLRRTFNGAYKIDANYYGSRAQRLFGLVTAQAEIFTDYGRREEKRQTLTVRLEKEKGVVTLGTVDIKDGKEPPEGAPVLEEKPEPDPMPVPPAARPQTYRVQPGDTLTGIARRFYGDPAKWRDLYDANPQLEDFNLLREGVELRLP